jgi:hypothetical protein
MVCYFNLCSGAASIKRSDEDTMSSLKQACELKSFDVEEEGETLLG